MEAIFELLLELVFEFIAAIFGCWDGFQTDTLAARIFWGVVIVGLGMFIWWEVH